MLSRPLTQELWNPPDYVLAVQHAIRTVESAGHTSFLEICRRSQGAFPTLVARFANAPIADSHSYYDPRTPYPSPARGEWYFTRSTSQMLASHLGVSPLLVGTPSVAELLVNATLIDSSPWVRERFVLHGSILLINQPVEETDDVPSSDSAIIDPPWYGGAIEDWLTRASHAVKPGGTILVPLMGELTRPEGRADRAAVRTAMERIGTFEIVERAVEYSTPRFEECAMAAAGITLGGPWRIADLAIVKNDRPSPRSEIDRRPGEWTDHRMGDDIISVRSSDEMDTTLPNPGGEIKGLVTLDSVSRRHPLLQEANLWSSRNRIARVDDVNAARRALALNPRHARTDTKSLDLDYGIRLRAALLGEVEC